MNTLKSFEHLIMHHFSGKTAEFEAFCQTGYSFEEWFNWELYFALSSSDGELVPKPAYKNHGLSESTKIGDIFFSGSEGRYIVEVALVHDYTQDKWLDKIRSDRDQLLTLRELEDMIPIQLIVMVSGYNAILDEASWSDWLSKLDFWGELKQIDITLRLPNAGQAWIVGWIV